MTGGCGAGQTATDMARFADAKETYLRGFLKLSAGLPSHDTFSRLFRLLDLVKFSAWFQRFTAAFDAELRGVIAVDGKVLRRSHDKARRKSALHMVSAWGCKAGLLLAQIATDAKSNEITAVPKLLAMLALKGTIVTVDALNCQRAIAAQIVAQGGDYALPLKENQPSLLADVSLFLDDPATKPDERHQSVDADHGRIETRTATVSSEIGWLTKTQKWPGLRAIGKLVRERESDGKTSPETAYHVISTPMSAERFNQVVHAHWRAHWQVKNRLHWRLDVVMNEDQARSRAGHGAHNLAVLRHMALNVMQKDGTKESLRAKFQKAGWNERYLNQLTGDVLKCDCPWRPWPASCAAYPGVIEPTVFARRLR